MILQIVTISTGLITGFCAATLVLGFGLSYLVWQKALRSKSRRIVADAEAEAEVIRKEKILQAKERFLQLKTEHEKVIKILL